MKIHETRVRPTIFNNQISIASSTQTMTNHHENFQAILYHIPFQPLNMKEGHASWSDTHDLSFHQHLDEVASMTYQAYQTCALSSSFI
jgi:hypothetical protein